LAATERRCFSWRRHGPPWRKIGVRVLARAKAWRRASRSSASPSASGLPDPGHIVEAAVKAQKDGHHGYTPANGIPQVREAVAADLHRRHGVNVDPANVLIVPGGKVTMYFAISMFGEPGAEIMPGPASIYRSVIGITCRAVPIPLCEKRLRPRCWPRSRRAPG
jgi:aspartate/methionine/tyrosine aminotransferase